MPFFIPIPVSSSVLLNLPPSLPLRAVYVQVQRYFRDFNGHTRSGLRFLKKSPRLRVVFVSKNLVSPNPCLLKHLKHKHTEATGRRIKNVGGRKYGKDETNTQSSRIRIMILKQIQEKHKLEHFANCPIGLLICLYADTVI